MSKVQGLKGKTCERENISRRSSFCSLFRGLSSILYAGALVLAGVVKAGAAVPQYQAAGAAAFGTGAITVAWPAHRTGDVALLFVESSGGEAISLTTPNGFVQVTNSPQATGAGTAGTRIAVYWARATSGSMASPVVADPGDHVYGQILTFRGVIPSGNPWNITGGGVKTPTSVSVTAAGVTTTVPEVLLVLGVARNLDSAAAFVSAWVNAGLANITERVDAGDTSGVGGGLAVMTGTKTVAGATGNTAVTVTNSLNAYLNIALKPLAPPTTIQPLINVSTASLTASWNLVSEATGYTLAASINAANPPSPIYASSTTLGNLSAKVAVPALAADTTYYLFVRSNGLMTNSNWAIYSATSTLANTPAFTNFTNISTSVIRANWSANGNRSPGTRYRVLTSTAPDPENPAGAVVVTSDTLNLFLSSSGLRGNTTYYFSVAAINSNGVLSDYDAVEGTSTLAYVPVFNNFTGIDTGSVQFNWMVSSNAYPGTLYRVLTSTAPDPANPSGAEVTSSDTYNIFLSSSGLDANTTYYFRVAGVNNNGIVTAYAAARGTSTLANIPVPDNFTEIGETDIQFNWLPNGNPDLRTLYRVWTSTAPDPLNPDGAKVTSSDTYNTYLSTSGLAVDTYYSFVVAARNNNGIFTSYSDPDTASTFGLSDAPTIPKFQAAGTPQGGTGAVTPAWPPAHQIDDVALLFVEASGGEAISLTTPNGFVQVPNSPQATGAGTAGTRIAVYWARATSGSMAAPVVADPGNHVYAVILTFRGVIRSGDPFDITGGGVKAGASTALTATGVTTAVQETLAVTGVTSDLAAAAFASAWDNFSLSGVTERFDNGTASGGDGGIAVMTGRKLYAGATGDTGLTVANSINAFLTIALKPLTPPVPTLPITDVAARAMTASWDLVSGATGYTLAVSLSSANPPTSIYASSAATGASATLDTPALDMNTTYYLFVQSNGLRMNSSWAAYPGTSTLLEYTPALAGFSNISDSAMQFDWSANGNPDGIPYVVVVSTAPDPLNPSGAVVTTSNTYNTYLSTSGLIADTTYYFRAAGINNNGVPTAFSGPDGTATLLTNAPVFNNFTNVSASAVRFNWLPNGNPNPGTFYRVMVSTAPDPFNPDGAVVTSSDTYNIFLTTSGLSADSTYYFQVAGLNKSGTVTAYTAVEATSTWANVPAIAGFTNIDESSMQVNWTANGNRDPGTLYRVLTSTAPNPVSPPAGAVVSSSDTYNTFLSTSGLRADTTYYFSVAAINNGGRITSYVTSPGTATWANVPVFNNFTNISASAVRFNWSVNGNPPSITLYRVLASTAPDPSAPGGAVVTTSNTYNTYLSSSGLSANTTYYFRVAAVNWNNIVSNYSAQQGTSTWVANVPTFNNFAGVSVSAIQLNWLPNGNPNPGTQYRVLTSTAANPSAPSGAVVTTSDTYNISMTTSGLNANVTYYFQVAGLNNNGVETTYMGVRGTSTLANVPTGLAASGETDVSVYLDWSSAGNGPGTRYRLFTSTASNPSAPAGARVTSSDTFNVNITTSGLRTATSYYFLIRAINNNGILTSSSSVINTKTLPAGGLGEPIIGAFTSVNASSISANWSIVTGATGYTLVASVNSGDPPNPIFASSTTIGNGGVSASVFSPDLAANTTYYLFVRSNGPAKLSAWAAYSGTSTLVANVPLFDNFTNVSETGIQFNWLPNGNPSPPGTLYRVLVSTASNPLSPSGAVVTSSYTYNISLSTAGLNPNATYYFRVAGVNNNNVPTAYAAAQGTSTWANVPAFTNFTNITASAMRFNWSPNGNPAPGTLYRVLSSTAPDPYAPAGAVVSASDTYNAFLSSSGLSLNTTYYFRVAAVNGNGILTSYDTPRGTSTLTNAPVFNNFTGVGAGAIQFNWLPNSNPNPGTLYRVLASTAPDPSNPSGAVVSSSDTYNIYLNSSGLDPNTTYYFQAAGLNNNGTPTAYTAAAATATLASLPLTAVTTFSAVGPYGFSVAWNNNSNPLPETLYVVQASTAADFNAGATNQVTASTAPAAGPAYTFTGLTFSTTYYFQVRARNLNGVYTNFVQLGSTKTLGLPPPDLGSVTDVSTYSLTAGWQLVSGATGYTLAVSVNPDNPPSPVFASSATLGDLSAGIAGLGPNTTYYLFARANGPGESGGWAAYPATSTWANLPLTVVSTFSAVTYDGFRVYWDNNSNPLGSTLYTVHISTAYDFNAGATNEVSFSTAPAAGPSAAFTSLNPDTLYYFRVRAIQNDGGFTGWQELGFIRTLAQPALHSGGDGVLFYGQTGNTTPQFRNYYFAGSTFSSVANTVPNVAGSLFLIKTSPLNSVQEAVAGYVKNGILHVLCTDGTNWSEDWTQTVGGTERTRRFDIAYETNTGDVMVLYSKDSAGSNEMGYRTKSGSDSCGSGSWSANTDLNPARTSGVVQWVKMASDRRTSYSDIAAIWADASSDLSAMVWTGTAWENEPASALSTTLEVVTSAQDVEDFDVDYESLSGDIMVVWADAAGGAGANGVRYAAATWTGGSPLHTWGGVQTPPTFADDATNLALSASPDDNRMLFSSIGNAGSDLQVGEWSGTAWTARANLDTSCQTPAAGTKLVSNGWLSVGGVSTGVVVYADATVPTGIAWTRGFTVQTSSIPLPAFGATQVRYDIAQDPVNKDRLVLLVSSGTSGAGGLQAKRLLMTAGPAFSWSDANSGALLETKLASAAVSGASFAFWPAAPVTTFSQSSYRFFANADSTDVGAPLAAQDAPADLPSAGAAFRLRALVHIGQVDLPVSGQSFRLQFAGKGDGDCDTPNGGVPASYTDVTAGTIIAFNNNSPADGAALTANANDPQHGAHFTVNQRYEELNDFTNSASAIVRNRDGMWDFALKDNGVSAGTAYCFRFVKADGSALNSYDSYPELSLPAALQLNEVYAAGSTSADDWVEIYNNSASTVPLIGWKLYYTEDISPNLVWTGQAGDTINSMSTFTITTLSMNLNGGQNYGVSLKNNGGNLVDQVMWPAGLSAGQSFARVADGEPDYFEIDPTPTRNYANARATDTLKINEVAYGTLGVQFVELYNTSAVSTMTLVGYSLRNSAASANGLRFKFTRKVYPRNYTIIDDSSRSDDGLYFADVFGAQGLDAAGDFVAVENSTGSTVDQITWQSGSAYSRYDFLGDLVSVDNYAPAGAAASIGRRPTEGADTDNDYNDFTSFGLTTLGSRNNGAGAAAANSLVYPADRQVLPRKFRLTLDLGVQASSAAANNIIFQRTGGATDIRSPHIYRLQDIGFGLGVLTQQTTVQFGFSLNDQDGFPLVSSVAYRLTLNTDTGSQSAPQIILGTVTYDASVQSVTGSTTAPLWMNNAARDSAIRLDISNNSPAGFNDLEVTTVTFKIMNSNLSAALTPTEARNLFNAVMLVMDSTSSGTSGVYESGIDLSTIAYLPMASINPDSTGVSTLTVLFPDLGSAAIPAASTRTFFVVLESTQNANTRTPNNVFRVIFNPLTMSALRDGPSDLAQDFNASAQVNTSSVTIIAPAVPPAGTAWPYTPPGSGSIQSPAGYYTYDPGVSVTDPVISSAVYVGSTDGYLRAIKKDGTLKWSYATSPLSPIRTSPLVVVESQKLYVYFADDNGDVYKVQDNDSGAGLVWSSATQVAVRSNIMCGDLWCTGPQMYFGDTNNKVKCINKADGQACAGWSYASAINAPISGTIAIDDRATINSGWIGLENGRIVALHTADGTSPTSYQTGGAIKSSPYLDGRDASANNVLFFTSTDGKLYARVSSNLTQLPAGWPAGDYNANSAIYTSPFSIGTRPYIFFGDDAGRLHQVKKSDGTSAAGWPFQAGAAIRSSPVYVPDGSVPQGGNDYVYFGCDDGYIYAVDAITGVLRQGWPVATGGPVRADPVIDTDNSTLVIGSNDGKTYVLYIGP